MAESKATAPDFVLYVEVDMEEAVELRKQLKAAAGERPAPSFNDLIVKAAALALTEFPRANGAYRDGQASSSTRASTSASPWPARTRWSSRPSSTPTASRSARSPASRARWPRRSATARSRRPSSPAGTFTVSNLGMYGIDRIVPVINPPQAAILGVGAMSPQPVVVDGEVTVRTRMTLTLVCDHRILYGADAAEFLARIRERLENPLSLAL